MNGVGVLREAVTADTFGLILGKARLRPHTVLGSVADFAQAQAQVFDFSRPGECLTGGGANVGVRVFFRSLRGTSDQIPPPFIAVARARSSIKLFLRSRQFRLIVSVEELQGPALHGSISRRRAGRRHDPGLLGDEPVLGMHLVGGDLIQAAHEVDNAGKRAFGLALHFDLVEELVAHGFVGKINVHLDCGIIDREALIVAGAGDRQILTVICAFPIGLIVLSGVGHVQHAVVKFERIDLAVSRQDTSRGVQLGNNIPDGAVRQLEINRANLPLARIVMSPAGEIGISITHREVDLTVTISGYIAVELYQLICSAANSDHRIPL